MSTRAHKWLWGIAIVGFVAGLIGLVDYWQFGHGHTNYGSYVPWGLWVAMYLFLVGVASGAFMIATLDLLFHVPLFKGVGRAALWGALVALPAGLISIWIDLGHMERIWRVFMHPNFFSVMAQMVWGYSVFGVITVAALWLSRNAAQARLLKGLMIVGLLLAIFVSGGVGALIGVQTARPYWHVGLFPAQFPVFSLASGAALLLVILGFFGNANDPRLAKQLWALSITTVLLQLVKLYFLWVDFSQSLYGGIPMNVESVRQVMFGSYWWAFWIIQIGLGTVLPLIVLAQRKLATLPQLAGWMGMLVLVGFAVARANILFPGMTVPELEALRGAFVHPRLSFEYFPSITEWLLQIWIVSTAAIAFLVGIKYFPVTSPEGASHE